MKIVLKKLSVNNRLSEETICFSADLWIDGKKAGYASNRGHGGSTDYHITDRSLEARAKAWARTHYQEHGTEEDKELLSPMVEGGWSPDPLEYLIDQLVEESLASKEEVKIARLEAKQAAQFHQRGYPFMLRIETYGSIVWYGLKSDAITTVASATAAARAKHGEVTRAVVLPTARAAS